MLAGLYHYALIIIINYYFNVCLCSIMGVWVHSIYYVVKWSVIMKLVLLYSQGCAVCSGQPWPTHCRSLPTHSLARAARSITCAAAAANGWLVVSPEAMSLACGLTHMYIHVHAMTCTRTLIVMHTFAVIFVHTSGMRSYMYIHMYVCTHDGMHMYSLQYIELLYKDTPEMRASPLIRIDALSCPKGVLE